METIQPSCLFYDWGTDVCAFSTRRGGGCSEGTYASFNVNGYCGDTEACVRRNREALCRMLRIDGEHLVMPHQTHDTQVLCVDENFFTLSPSQRQEQLEGVDALVTRLPFTCIGVSTADCIPILLYDAGTRTVAAVHAGWRGTAGRIVERTLALMKERLGVRPEDFQAVIGPGISLDAFEVGDEVYEAFRASGFPMDKLARRYPVEKLPEQTKWHIDLWEANRLQLVSAGVPDTKGWRVHFYLFGRLFFGTPVGNPFGAHLQRYYAFVSMFLSFPLER